MIRQKAKHKFKSFLAHPAIQKALISSKPKKSIWGFLGVVLFFFVPEIISFFYGVRITDYAKEALAHANTLEMKYYYELLEMMFDDGVSWSNLIAGAILLVWMFF